MQDVESEWLDHARKGDADAFGQLVEAYQTPVYNLCYRMLGDSYEAEDAAQESFLRAYKSLWRYDPERSFSTWLLSIAAHYCIDQIRKRRMIHVPIEMLPYGQIADPTPNPEAFLSTAEEQRGVRALLETLSPTDRAAVVMLYWYAFSYEEIASALDLTVSAVKSRLHRARRALAQSWIDQSPQHTPVERKSYEEAQSSAFRGLAIF